MDVTCQSCRATYKVDDAKIPPQGIKAKCPKCGSSFLLKKPEDAVIAVGGDEAPPPDPFAGFGAAPPDLSGFGAAPAPDPFAAMNGGSADPFAAATGGAVGPPPVNPFGSAGAPDPFAAGFGGGGFGGGGFDPPPPADGGAPGIGGLFQAKTAFEIRRATGEQIGPFDLFTIKQMIYEQQLVGNETLLDAAGNWVPITTVEDLGEIFRLTGAPAADGGAPAPAAPWGGAPEAPKPAGWQKHESVAPPPPPPVVPVERSRPERVAAPPPPPVALDTGRGRGVGEKFIIATEGLWSLGKRKGVRIGGAIVLGLALLGGAGYHFRWQLAHLVGLAGPIEASRLVAEGDRTLASGERGPMLTALLRYGEALKKYEKGVDARARSAEVAAAVWFRDPVRVDMQAMAEANLGKAQQSSPEAYSVLRAQARVALAKRDLAGAEVALGRAASTPEGASDPLLTAIRADVLFEKGDFTGAEAAYAQAKGNPATAALGSLGVARSRLRAGDYGPAAAEVAEALRLEPGNGLALAMSAYLATRNGGDVLAARRTLREIAASPARFGVERGRASYYLGVLSEESGATSPALHHLRNAIRHYPTDAEALAAAKRLFAARFPDRPVDVWIAAVAKVRGSSAMEKVQTGEIEFERRNWTAALSPLLAATQEDTGSARAQYALGRLLVEISAVEKAKAKVNFERAIALDPEWADPVMALSKWELDARNTRQARALGEKAIQLDPTLPEAYRVAAAAALAEKDYSGAESVLAVAVELDPEDYVSWLDLGEARRLGGRPEEAIPAIEKAALLRPELAEPRVRLGAAYEALKDLERASEYYLEAAKIEPANLAIATRLGVVVARKGDTSYPDARRRLEAVVREQSGNAEAQYWLGVSYQFTAEPEKAMEAYRAAIKADYFDKYLAHYHLGELLGKPGASRDVDAARDHLNKCLELDPAYFPCLEEQAEIARTENQYDEAIKLLRKVETSIAALPAAKRNPVIIRVVLRQGKIAKQQGRPREAEALFKKVLKLEPKSAEAMWNLGELAKENDTRVAKAWYTKAIAAQQSYAPPYRDIGFILKEENNECGAKRMFLRFLELSTSPEEKKGVEDELQILQCDR